MLDYLLAFQGELCYVELDHSLMFVD